MNVLRVGGQTGASGRWLAAAAAVLMLMSQMGVGPRWLRQGRNRWPTSPSD
jgi:hypothetical protein